MVQLCTPEQLALWGWRVPFLLVWPTGAVVFILRLLMPEPAEFVEAQGRRKQQRAEAAAAAAQSAAEAGDGDGGADAGAIGVRSTHGNVQGNKGVEAGGKLGVWWKRHREEFDESPVVMLFRFHWRELLLNFCMLAW